MTEFNNLIKIGAESIGFDMDDDVLNNGLLSHVKIELLALILIVFIFLVPVELMPNYFFRTSLIYPWKLAIFLLLFFIIRRTMWFRKK